MKDYDYGSKPISGWGYVGRAILWNIPVIGWLILLFKALFAKNRNVKNYARSYFCGLLLIIIIAVVAVVGAAIGSLAGLDVNAILTEAGITL